MKTTIKAIFTGLLLLAFSAGARAEDRYDQLAKEITEAGTQVQGKKIAIIPFSYADGRAGATKDGSVISERLTIKMINMHKFEIIERSVLDKVMTELKLQSSGMIDASSAQQLGKVLGVEAIVTGTLVETSGGQIEVNARLIKTETAQAIGASQVTLDKNWIGDISAAPQPVEQPAYQQPQQPQQQVYQQPVYQQAPAAPVRAPRARGEFEYGFFDIFGGFGSPKMDIEFSNPTNKENLANIGLPSDGSISNGPYNAIKIEDLATSGAAVAMKVGGFGKGALGGDMELSFESRKVKAQKASGTVDSRSVIYTIPEEYATVRSFGISGDLLIRHPGKRIDPYFGLGLGLSLNSITMPSVYGYTSGIWNKPTEDFGLGLMLRVPVGLRIKVGDKTQIVTELRYELHNVYFDRDRSSESDTISMSGVKFNVGLGFTF